MQTIAQSGLVVAVGLLVALTQHELEGVWGGNTSRDHFQQMVNYSMLGLPPDPHLPLPVNNNTIIVVINISSTMQPNRPQSFPMVLNTCHNPQEHRAVQ